jgi:CCR4-NOT complex subunit CAF16
MVQVTVDLDVMVRQELLQFLIEDTKTRDCTVVYATHIFDGLDNFPVSALLNYSLGSL